MMSVKKVKAKKGKIPATRFDILTIFPEAFDSYLNSSMLKRAQEKGLIKIKIYNIRDFVRDKHRKVDDRPYGGGPGMVFKIEPLALALSKVAPKKNQKKTKVILFSPAGRQFDSLKAKSFSKKYNHFIFVAGHYEGTDERIKKIIKALGLSFEELSIGSYVLTGGELPAMVIIDSVSRHLKGVLGKEESLEEERLGVGVPAYTRPEVFIFRKKKYEVPEVLLSGDHKKIEEWRKKQQLGGSSKAVGR